MAETSDQGIDCTVQNAEQLPADLGGRTGVCSIIEKTLLPSIQSAGISPSAITVTVNVKSDSRASAVAVVNGAATAEQNVASSDRALSAGAIQMLANGIAAEIAKLGA